MKLNALSPKLIQKKKNIPTVNEKSFEVFEKKYPVDTIVEGEVVNKNEYSLFVKLKDIDVDAFLHCNDLTYSNNGEEELSKYKKGDKIKVKVLEIKKFRTKIRVGFDRLYQILLIGLRIRS